MTGDAHDGAGDDGPCQWAEYDWEGPFDVGEVIPERVGGVMWTAEDAAAGWWACVEGTWGKDGYLRPGVRWAVRRPGPDGAWLMSGVTRSLDAAVLDAERYVEELLEAAPAEQLLEQALGPGDG